MLRTIPWLLAVAALITVSGEPESDYREMRREFLGGLQGVHVGVFATKTAGPEAGETALRRTVEDELRAAGVVALAPEDAAGKAAFPMLSVVLEGLVRPDGLFVGQLSLRLNEPAALLRTGQRVSAETWADGLTFASEKGRVAEVVGTEVRRIARDFAQDFRAANAGAAKTL